MKLYLGLDTCGENSTISLVKNGEVKSYKTIPVRTPAGKCKNSQGSALVSHIENIPALFDKVEDMNQICAVGYCAQNDSGVGGCSVGRAISNLIASLLKIPCFEYSHREIYIANAIFSEKRDNLFENPFVSFRISKVDTEILLIEPNSKSTIIGGTLDITFGGAIDQICAMIGISCTHYSTLEKLAMCSERKNFTGVPICVFMREDGVFCSLLGLLNKITSMIDNNSSSADIAAYALLYLSKTLDVMLRAISQRYNEIPVHMSGDLSSSIAIRGEIMRRRELLIATGQSVLPDSAVAALLTERAMGDALKYEKSIVKK